MDTLEGTHDRLHSVTAILIIEDHVPSIADLNSLSQAMEAHFVDSDILLVANGVDNKTSLALKSILVSVSDTSVVFLGGRSDFDLARIVGIDHAIGDYVFLGTTGPAQIAVLPAMVKAAQEGFDLIVAKSKKQKEKGYIFYRMFRSLYSRLLRSMTGIAIDLRSPAVRLLSRPAALHVLSQRHGEILLKSLSLGSGFPSKVMIDAFEIPNNISQKSVSQSMGKGLRAMVSSGTMPMRFASISALGAGGLALLYSLYVITTYIFKPDVAPGWTTVSLQVSGMMFLFSLIFVLLVEYTIQIYESMPVSRRSMIIRELHSELSRRSGRLNVVDSNGEFLLGAPEDLAPEIHFDAKQSNEG